MALKTLYRAECSCKYTKTGYDGTLEGKCSAYVYARDVKDAVTIFERDLPLLLERESDGIDGEPFAIRVEHSTIGAVTPVLEMNDPLIGDGFFKRP